MTHWFEVAEQIKVLIRKVKYKDGIQQTAKIHERVSKISGAV